MRRIVIVLVGALVVVLGATWVGVAVTDDDSGTASREPGSMMSTGLTRGAQDGFGMMPGGPGSGSPGTGGAGMGSGMMAVDTEADYLVAMVPHHEEAIAAAEELARSERPEMRELGRSIVASQTAQIEQMESWLERWHPDADLSPGYEPMMRDLSGLSGDELDEAFLVDMIPHHMVAVMMSQRLLMHGEVEHAEVAALARDVSTEQRREIALMRTWLVAWFAG